MYSHQSAYRTEPKINRKRTSRSYGAVGIFFLPVGARDVEESRKVIKPLKNATPKCGNSNENTRHLPEERKGQCKVEGIYNSNAACLYHDGLVGR
jgi:hypothetical protein